MKKPLLGYVEQEKLTPDTYRTFLPILLFFCLLSLTEGVRMLGWGNMVGIFAGGLMLLMCPCLLFLAFLYWRLTLAARTPDWRGDRWLQPKARAEDSPSIDRSGPA